MGEKKWKANVRSDGLSLIEFGHWLPAYSINLISKEVPGRHRAPESYSKQHKAHLMAG